MDISRQKLKIIFLLLIIFNCCTNTKRRVEYYDNGEIKSSFTEENGEVQGTQYNYYANGVLKSKLNFKSGRIDGIAQYYDTLGNLERKVEWKMGIQNGILEQYYKNGKLFMKESYLKGNRIGLRKVFALNGNLLKNEIYDSLGNSIYVVSWDENGTKLYSSVVPVVTISKDTVNVNEDLFISVKFAFNLSGSMDIEFSEISTTSMPLIETLLDSPKYNYLFKFRFSSPGYQYFIITPHHNPSEGDTLSANGTGKEVKLYVKPNDEV